MNQLTLRTAVREKIALAAETDFTRVRPFIVLGLLFLVLRAPFLNYGHGTDPDAWRVALTAHHLLDTGEYFPSRLPGNPLHELVMTPLIAGGWVSTNLATALVALLGVFLFAKIAKHHQLPHQGLLTFGFAFTPLLFINSISTMDYMWTLTAILASYHSVLRRQPVWAGLFLGIAIGFRLQSFLFFPPLALLLWRQDLGRSILPFGLAAAGAALLAFAPVLAVYGLDFYNFFDTSVAAEDVLRLLGKEALGVFGGLGVLAAALVSRRQLAQLPRDLGKDPLAAVWVLIIVLYFASFSRLPHEIAYLIPIFPFAYFLMARYFTRLALTGAIGAILLAGVVDLTTPSDSLSLSSLSTAKIGRGLVLSNAQTMTSQREFVEEVVSADLPNHSIVMTGFIFPQLAVRERGRLATRILERDYAAISMLSDRGEAAADQRDVRYVWLLTYDTFDALRSQGYAFFLVPDAAGGTAALYDYRPSLFGATFLRLDQQRPSSGKGAASTDR